MSRTIAINGTRLDEVRMPLVPYANGSVASLSYPTSEIRFSRDGDTIGLVVPAYLGVELYRIGLLPQDAKAPVEISISGHSVGRYIVSDVRYPHGNDHPFGQVIFMLTRAVKGNPRDAGEPRRPRSAAAGSGTYVADITHYLDETGELAAQLPGPARKLASFLTLLIDAATGARAPSAGEHDSRIRCRAKACRGTIRTSLSPAQDEISWHCPVCGHNGVISNWQNTKWNQLNRREESE
jgi:hypothetical protein